jgi:hypothetical protein
MEMAIALDEVVFSLRFKLSQMTDLMYDLFSTDTEEETLQWATKLDTQLPSTAKGLANKESLSIVPSPVTSANVLRQSSAWLPQPILWPSIAFIVLLIGFSFIGGVYIANQQFRRDERTASIPPAQTLNRLARNQQVTSQVLATRPTSIALPPNRPSPQKTAIAQSSRTSISIPKIVREKRIHTRRSASKKHSEPPKFEIRHIAPSEEKIGERARNRLKANPFG